MKLCILGGTGQLGHEIQKVFSDQQVVSLGRKDLDIANEEEVYRKLKEVQPAVILHAAAFTNVDQCEVRQERAFQVNGVGTKHVAVAAANLGSKLIYMSTDYVFDGKKDGPYGELDTPNPINIYGQSKLMGERAVMANCEDYIIVRTAWLYGAKGNNFVKTILRLASHNSLIKVVDDQVGSPTAARDLAWALRALLLEEHPKGIYHLTNDGSCSWFKFAEVICQEKGIPAKVLPITSEEINRKAPRPKNSVLANHSSIKLRHWREAIHHFLKEEME